MDATDFGGGHDYGIGLVFGEPDFGVGLGFEVEFVAGGSEEVGESFGFEEPDYSGADHAAVACDVDFCVGIRH